MSQSILDVRGIGPASVAMLAEKGINSVDDIAALTPMQLSAVKGFNQARSQQVIADAIALLASEARQIEPEFARQEIVIEDNVDRDFVVKNIAVKATDQDAGKKANKKSKKKAKKSSEKSAKKAAKEANKKIAKKSDKGAAKKRDKKKKKKSTKKNKL